MFYKKVKIHYKIPTPFCEYSATSHKLQQNTTKSLGSPSASQSEATSQAGATPNKKELQNSTNSNKREVCHSRFIVHVDQGEKRFYLSFTSSSEFQRWYVTLAPHEKTMNEVVVSNNRKLIIDIDHPDSDYDQSLLLFYDFERHVTSRIHDVFMTLGIGKPEIIVYDMCNDEHGSFCKISYHVVVTNFVFSAETCKGLCMIISSGQVWDKCVDTGIYKKKQCIRIEDSTKFGENRQKKRTVDNELPFSSGLLSDFRGTTESHIVCNINKSIQTNSQNPSDSFFFEVC
jgi:hypothetical protein